MILASSYKHKGEVMKNGKLAERRQLWIDRVQQQIASGLNKKEWCHQNQVPLDTFYYWSEKLDHKKSESC